MAVERRPVERVPSHPGELLGDFLRDRGITQQGLADAVGANRVTLSRLVTARHALTARMALKIEAAIGAPALPLLCMQAMRDLWLARMRAPA